MEYIYAAMLLHKAGQKIDEASVKKVLSAANVKVDEARVKALVASLEGVDIEKAIETAAVAVAAPVHATAEHKAEGRREEAKKRAEEEKKSEEQAAAGLG